MNSIERLVAVFEELKPYLGDALKGGRIGKRLTAEELSERLTREFDFPANARLVTLIEEGSYDLSFDEFDKI